MFKVVFRKLMADLSVPFRFYKGDYFRRVWFILIPEFVSVNVQLEFIVRDKLWPL